MKVQDAVLIKQALAAHIDELEKLAEGGPVELRNKKYRDSKKPGKRNKGELGIGTLRRFDAGKVRSGK